MSFKTLPFVAAVVLLAAAFVAIPQRKSEIRRSSPERQGMNGKYLTLIDSTVNASIQDGDVPGAVVGVVRNGALVFEKSYGNKSIYPEEEPMTVETMFDLASVSKCVGTTLSIMQLVEQGKLRLVDSVARYIPGFKPWVDPKTGEQVPIRVQDLLTHASGLDAYMDDMDGYLAEFGPLTPDSLMKVIATRIPRNFKPGTDVLYSCLNFITLQHILETITGERLCDYAQKNVFDALHLKHTCYFPWGQDNALRPLAAPTEKQPDGSVLRGIVHDPIARIINGGNSGNAGVFSNVEDLAVICAALLNGGIYNGHRILSPLTVDRMFAVPPANDPKVARALGWDCYYPEPYTSGDIFAVQNLRGHTGFTGTSVILDPDTNTAVIILAHRVHPVNDGSASRMRSTVASIVAASIGR